MIIPNGYQPVHTHPFISGIWHNRHEIVGMFVQYEWLAQSKAELCAREILRQVKADTLPACLPVSTGRLVVVRRQSSANGGSGVVGHRCALELWQDVRLFGTLPNAIRRSATFKVIDDVSDISPGMWDAFFHR